MNKTFFKIINPVVSALLRSPLHAAMSQNTVLLEFRGRKSGKAYAMPVSYYQGAGQVICCTARSNIWWRNLSATDEISLVLRGRRVTGKPTVVTDDPAKAQDLLRQLLIASPRDASHAGVKLEADGRPNESDVAVAALGLVFIVIDIDRET